MSNEVSYLCICLFIHKITPKYRSFTWNDASHKVMTEIGSEYQGIGEKLLINEYANQGCQQAWKK